MDNVASVAAVDLLGNGTACLVWSSPLPGASRVPMQYLNLMAEGKPHLLVRTVNNLGAETRVHYAPSTYFYLQDKYAGQPWVTKLPFPVHVVERVETFDAISQNRFVTRYAYHHGYFDGPEREFRGFGMVEKFDTEAFAAPTMAVRCQRPRTSTKPRTCRLCAPAPGSIPALSWMKAVSRSNSGRNTIARATPAHR